MPINCLLIVGVGYNKSYRIRIKRKTSKTRRKTDQLYVCVYSGTVVHSVSVYVRGDAAAFKAV